MSEVTHYIKIFIAIAVLVNPIEGIPLFITNTRSLSHDQKLLIAKKASVAVFIILLVSMFAGRYVLELFGIGIPSFSTAGGVIIFLIALQMVIGKTDSGEKSLPSEPPQDYSDIAIVPLAIPLLAGPGAISSVIVYGGRSSGLVEDIFLSVIVIVVAASVFIALNIATRMEKAMNQTAIKIMTKISGLLVAAIAVELVFTGLKNMYEQSAK